MTHVLSEYRFNIRVNAVLPGFIETPMTETVPENLMQMTKLLIPLGRLGNPEGKNQIFSIMVEISCFQVLASETVLDSSLCSKCSIV